MQSYTPTGIQPNFNPSGPQNLNAAKKPLDKKKILINIFLGLFGGLLVFSLVWFVFLRRSIGDLRSPLVTDGGPNEPEIAQVLNPLTGELVSEEEASAWSDFRPLSVMINNHPDARPQSGLINADIVFEIVAEGGITRFLAFFLSENPEKIGPVRSTREYYLVLVKELGDAMLMHIGWSPQALEAIETWPVRSLGRGGAPFWRDNSRNVATEHTAYISGPVMRETAVNLGWEGTRDIDSWKFKNDSSKYSNEASATSISIDFWYEGDFSAGFNYDAENNVYLRTMGFDASGSPEPHLDNETQKQIAVKNVVVQFATESTIAGDDKNRLTYELLGSGTGLIFLDGKVIKATWSKPSRDERTKFYDLNGGEIEFNRGKIWVSIVPDRNVDQVVYQ